MRIGITSQGYVRKDADVRDRVRQVVEMAQAAERYGLDFFGCSEQHLKFPTNSTGATEVILTAAAATTERIRVRPGAVVMSLHHPLNVAERWATIDLVSNGRLDFAVGRGNTPKTAAAFQVDVKETNARTAEGLAIVLKAWTHDEFSWDGEFWQFEDVRVNPCPQQNPPDVWWAAVSVGAAALAGQMRLGYMGTCNNLEWHQVEERVTGYRDAWAGGQALENARPNERIVMSIPTHVARTMEAAREQVEYGIVEYTNRAMKQDLLNHELTYGNTAGMDTTGEFFDNFQGLLDKTSLAVGSPEYAAEKIARFHELGVDEVALAMDYATHEQLLEAIQLIGEEVAPLVRKAAPTPVESR